MITLTASEMGCIRAALKQLTTRKLKRKDAVVWKAMVERLQQKLQDECDRVSPPRDGSEPMLELELEPMDFSDLDLPSYD